MKRTIVLGPSQRRFEVDEKPAFRETKNASYPLVTPCCSNSESGKFVHRKQSYTCEDCGKEVGTKDCTHKHVKIGDNEGLVPIKLLEDIRKQIEKKQEITLSNFVDEKDEPEQLKLRIEGVKVFDVVKKNESQYAELAEVLKGKIAFGRGFIGGNDQAVAMRVSNGVLVMNLIADETQVSFNSAKVSSEVNEYKGKVEQSLVELQRKLIEKQQQKQPFDFEEYAEENGDVRIKMEQDLIIGVLRGDAPTFVAPVVEEQINQNEEARLKALLGE